MEKNDFRLGLDLKEDFEREIVLDNIEGPSVLMVGTTPRDLAISLAREGLHTSVCSNNIKDMNTISSVARRERIPIDFKEYDKNLGSFGDNIFNSVIDLPTYEFDDRHKQTDLADLVRICVPGGKIFWCAQYEDTRITDSKLPEDIKEVVKPVLQIPYGSLLFLDDDYNDVEELDSIRKLLGYLFQYEEVRHFWNWLQSSDKIEIKSENAYKISIWEKI